MGGIEVRRYPVGIQTFSEIRNDDYLYIDKTDLIYRLTHESGKSFFLSRPRRFGKSLLLSTMQAYFEGRRDLFEGLALDRLEDDWVARPVLRLDLSVVKTRNVDMLRSQLDDIVCSLEARFGRGDARTLGGRLRSLIERAHERTGRRVVALVDEYDAPLLNVLDDPDVLDSFRQVIREFFIPLKACDEHLRFVFLTGITKFSQLSIFSELNNLRNISMEPAYATICGISDEELREQLAGDVAVLARKTGVAPDEATAALKDNYDGYHFTEESPDIYNPFSLLSAFASGRIDSYWFGSGTPTSLIEMMRSRGWQIVDLTALDVLDSEFDAPTERAATPVAFLYQAGYLTIKAYDPESHVYTLGIPNREVSRGLSESLVVHAAPFALGDHNAFLIKFARALRQGDLDEALVLMRSYLAGIPYHLGSRDERGFETTFYLIFDLLGIQIETEFKTATGRVDAVVRARDSVYVMEFKYGKTAAEALAQIDAKGYLVPFEANAERLIKVGVNFSPEEQTIDDWIIEEAEAS